MLKNRPNVSGCSRTDSGVHAKSFFCHFDTDSTINNVGLVLGLNTHLPKDISVLKCYDVEDDFHARYSSTGKTYRYRVYCSDVKNPFLEGRALRIKQRIDFQKATEFCDLISGEHNFEAFSSIHRTVKDTVRTVFEAKITKTDVGFDFIVTANGFLYNMVRIMVGCLLDYALGKLSKEKIEKAFKTGERSLLGATASPVGLYLEKVHYNKKFK